MQLRGVVSGEKTEREGGGKEGGHLNQRPRLQMCKIVSPVFGAVTRQRDRRDQLL